MDCKAYPFGVSSELTEQLVEFNIFSRFILTNTFDASPIVSCCGVSEKEVVGVAGDHLNRQSS